MHSRFLLHVIFVLKITLLVHIVTAWSVANAGTILVTPPAGIGSIWKPWAGTFIRLDDDGNISCLSLNGSDCSWGNGSIPPKTNGGQIIELTCGSHHSSIYGISGYDTPNHWCNNAYADLYTQWKQDLTLSSNAEGDIMCFSRDGVNCLAQQDYNARRQPLDPISIKPLVCGEAHRKVWGNTGYDQPGHWCNRLPKVFTLAVTSDPQYPWKNEADIPSSGNAEIDSKISIPQAYQSINRYHTTKSPLAGVVVNGDVTAFGHGGEWDYMNQELATLKPPVFMGLGNHDYENNVNDCAQNGCVRNSLNAFEKYLPANVDVDRNVNYYYEAPANYKEYKGSYAWSKDINGVHFVFLNNEPTYSFSAEGYNAGDARRERFRIESAIPWLDVNLARARAQGKPIVLIYHKPAEFKETNGFTRARFESMVSKYKVSMIFWGHVHKSGTAPQLATFGGAASVYSGSASTQTYLIAKFDSVKGYADVYLSKKGDIDAMPLVVRAQLKSPTEVLKPDPQPFDISFINNGGYNAQFRLQYTNASGQFIQESTGAKMVGQGWTQSVPAGATNVEATAWAKTGLVWEPWRTIFSIQPAGPRCLKTYGTSLNAKWGDC